MTRESLPSFVATIVGILVMLLIAVDLIWELDGTVLGDARFLVYAALPGIVGAVVWISRGEPTWATLLWTVPIGAITAVLFFRGFLSPIEWLVVFAAFVGMALMLCTETARTWWYGTLLRMPAPHIEGMSKGDVDRERRHVSGPR